MLLAKVKLIKDLIVRFLILVFLAITTTSLVADCSPTIINNFIDIDPYTTSTFENTNYAYYPITSGQSYDYTDIKGMRHNYTLNKQDDAWVIKYKPLDLKIIAFFRQTINGAGGSSPQGTSETLEVFFNSGSVDLLNFIISDLDHLEGVRVIGYLDSTPVTPVISNLDSNQTLSYLATGEAQWFSDATSTNDSENTVSFGQPINKLVITNYKTINGDVSDSGGFNLHELIATVCDTPQAVPTLSEWGLILMTILLGIAGLGLNPSRVNIKN